MQYPEPTPLVDLGIFQHNLVALLLAGQLNVGEKVFNLRKLSEFELEAAEVKVFGEIGPLLSLRSLV